MKKIFLILIVIFQLQSCQAQDKKQQLQNDLIGKWEILGDSADGGFENSGNFYTFNADGTGRLDTAGDKAGEESKFTYTLTQYNCKDDEIVDNNYYLRITPLDINLGNEECLTINMSFKAEDTGEVIRRFYQYGDVQPFVLAKR